MRTYADRREYFIQAVTKRRRVLKLKAVEKLGGKCMICGYNRYQGGLDFHHIDPNDKEFAISGSGFSRSWARVEKEIKKCLLVCANCHREIEAKAYTQSQIEEIWHLFYNTGDEF